MLTRKKSTTYLEDNPFVLSENRKTIPVRILLDNVRSALNVGSAFRTSDALGIEKLYLSFSGLKFWKIKKTENDRTIIVLKNKGLLFLQTNKHKIKNISTDKKADLSPVKNITRDKINKKQKLVCLLIMKYLLSK